MCAERVGDVLIFLTSYDDPLEGVLESHGRDHEARGGEFGLPETSPSASVRLPRQQPAPGARSLGHVRCVAWSPVRGACALALCWCVATVAGAESVPEGCERFRSGGLVTERIEDFDLADPERAGVSFIEMRYDPAYLRDPAVPPRPDGLPDREQLFSLDALTGAPLTARDRRGRTSLGRRGTVNVMVQGDRSVIDIDAMIRAAALAPLDAPHHRTGELLAGFERLDIPSRSWTAEDAVNGKDVFARFGAQGRAEAVMSCYRPGDGLHPNCSVHLRMNGLAVDVSLIRPDELDHLSEIMTTVQDFVSCLEEAADATDRG